jgi:hypothetical protein
LPNNAPKNAPLKAAISVKNDIWHSINSLNRARPPTGEVETRACSSGNAEWSEKEERSTAADSGLHRHVNQ